jgi:enoyl-CoA hydratase/carnithine racemase
VSAEYQKIRADFTGPVATITLNFPERRNAIGPRMIGELLDALEAAKASSSCRVVLLQGEGKSFCGGADLAQMSSGDADPFVSKGDYADLLLALWTYDKPIVCKVQGHAMGGGLGLVAASHFAIAAGDAQLGTPEVGVGLFPMMIMAVLRRRMPRQAILDWMLLADKHTADEAKAAGLLHAVSAPESLDAEVSALCTKLVEKGAASVRIGLRALAEQDALPLEEALPKLRSGLAECLATNDAMEGLSAFMQRRTPNFTGK